MVENTLTALTIALACLPFLFLALICFLLWKTRFRVTEIELNLPGVGSMTCTATERDKALAWYLYVQLMTRMAALPFDEEYDVIAQVYDSLYQVFGLTREKLADLPLAEVQRQGCLADLVVQVQNKALRPHLTKWQAVYRRWWDQAIQIPENRDKSPQEIQRGFPKYTELVADLKRMNEDLANYAKQLLFAVNPSAAGRR